MVDQSHICPAEPPRQWIGRLPPGKADCASAWHCLGLRGRRACPPPARPGTERECPCPHRGWADVQDWPVPHEAGAAGRGVTPVCVRVRGRVSSLRTCQCLARSTHYHHAQVSVPLVVSGHDHVAEHGVGASASLHATGENSWPFSLSAKGRGSDGCLWRAACLGLASPGPEPLRLRPLPAQPLCLFVSLLVDPCACAFLIPLSLHCYCSCHCSCR